MSGGNAGGNGNTAWAGKNDLIAFFPNCENPFFLSNGKLRFDEDARLTHCDETFNLPDERLEP